VYKVSELCSVDFDLSSSSAAVRIVLVYIMQDHKCRMPPATTSANPQLVSSSSEDPSSFDNETGCMKGIFQLFDRHHSFSSRRYGSKRITTENGVGQPLPAPCDTPRYHQDTVSPYCTVCAYVDFFCINNHDWWFPY
jgi:hypothetical protein